MKWAFMSKRLYQCAGAFPALWRRSCAQQQSRDAGAVRVNKASAPSSRAGRLFVCPVSGRHVGAVPFRNQHRTGTDHLFCELELQLIHTPGSLKELQRETLSGRLRARWVLACLLCAVLWWLFVERCLLSVRHSCGKKVLLFCAVYVWFCGQLLTEVDVYFNFQYMWSDVVRRRKFKHLSAVRGWGCNSGLFGPVCCVVLNQGLTHVFVIRSILQSIPVDSFTMLSLSSLKCSFCYIFYNNVFLQSCECNCYVMWVLDSKLSWVVVLYSSIHIPLFGLLEPFPKPKMKSAECFSKNPMKTIWDLLFLDHIYGL